MKSKKEDKFIVLKREDLDNYFSQFTKGKFTTEAEAKVMDNVPFMQVLKDLKNDNKYIICNQDEPYAELIWQILLTGEDAKRANLDEKKLESQFKEFFIKFCRLSKDDRSNIEMSKLIKETFPFMEGKV